VQVADLKVRFKLEERDGASNSKHAQAGGSFFIVEKQGFQTGGSGEAQKCNRLISSPRHRPLGVGRRRGEEIKDSAHFGVDRGAFSESGTNLLVRAARSHCFSD
jgi:hypothetical protein